MGIIHCSDRLRLQGADTSVSVIRPDIYLELAGVAVGREPQSIAITPDGPYAYVANAPDGTFYEGTAALNT